METTWTQGWTPTSLQAMALLTAWLLLVLAHGLWRSRGEAAPDPVRSSGPVDRS